MGWSTRKDAAVHRHHMLGSQTFEQWVPNLLQYSLYLRMMLVNMYTGENRGSSCEPDLEFARQQSTRK